MFTRKQIEEIAAKLAELSKKDSQFYGAVTPFDSSERWPILQDGENRLMTFGQLQSILINGNKSGVQCTLNVSCSTEGSVIKINGYPTNTITTGYGEMVLVVVSAEDYDTWYEVITMTDDFDINVVLNKTGSDTPGPTPPTPTTQKFSVCVTGVIAEDGTPIEGASIYIGDSLVQEGVQYIYDVGEAVVISVIKEGYEPYHSEEITSNFNDVIRLTPNLEAEAYIEFAPDETVYIQASGGSTILSVKSNTYWELRESDLPDSSTPPSPSINEDNTEEVDLSPRSYNEGEYANLYN